MAVKNLMTKSFLERTISGIILVIVALITIISGGIVLDVTLGIVSLIGLTEFYKVYEIHPKGKPLPLYLAGCFMTVLWYVMVYYNRNSMFDILLIIFLIIFLCCYVFEFPEIQTRQVMAGIFGFLYVSVMLSYVFMIRDSHFSGAYNVWLVFLCSWGSDTCAYLVGVTMGKHKLAPVLSPKKSVEGFVGGILGAALLGFIYSMIFRDHIHMPHAELVYVVVCAVGSAISVVGDLAASAIKRKHGIKDYGHLIPGHGGILDRFDSVIITAPLIYFLLRLFQEIMR